VALSVGRGFSVTAALEGGEWSAEHPGRTLPQGKDSLPILQEAEWSSGPVWTGGKSRPHRDSIPDSPVRSQSLYRLSYRAHIRYLYIKLKQEQKRTKISDSVITNMSVSFLYFFLSFGPSVSSTATKRL